MDEAGAPPAPRPVPTVPPRKVWLAATLIVVAGVLAYANTFTAPFVFDDFNAITANPSIRHLWPPGAVLVPPVQAGGAAARPLVNLSLAINYAIGGDSPAGYHAFNLLVHLAAGLALFGFLRRTLELPGLRPRWGSSAFAVAFFSALLWTVHPLNTEAVTCVIQRSESLFGLWLLLMFYCLARAEQAVRPRRWLAGSAVACYFGMLTKEVMVVAPVLALLFLVLLVDGSWRAAWARRGKFLAVLAAGWLPLAWLVARNLTRHGAAGFGQGIAWWEYALTQCQAIVVYLRLSFWPHPLVLDYGEGIVRQPATVLPQMLVVAGLLAATGVAWVRRHPAAFAGAWFFLILAPSSSVLPLVSQTMAEHRMYVPLAAVVVLSVAALHHWLKHRAAIPLTLLAAALLAATVQRNAVYRTAEGLWRDTVAKAPANARAHNNLANLLDDAGDEAGAKREYEIALRLKPTEASAHYNLANLLARAQQFDEAVTHYQAALRLRPDLADAHTNLGNTYALLGQAAAARTEFTAALRLNPDDAVAHHNLADSFFAEGRFADAAPHYEAALPELSDSDVRLRLVLSLAGAGRPAEARAALAELLRLDPGNAEARALQARLAAPVP